MKALIEFSGVSLGIIVGYFMYNWVSGRNHDLALSFGAMVGYLSCMICRAIFKKLNLKH